MHDDKLIKMANQIGDFFVAMPDRRQAVDDIASHIRRMWEPRMRRAFFAHIDSHGPEGLNDILQEVVVAHRQDLEPPPVKP
jgi:formate dehydrogenase subunit delta